MLTRALFVSAFVLGLLMLASAFTPDYLFWKNRDDPSLSVLTPDGSSHLISEDIDSDDTFRGVLLHNGNSTVHWHHPDGTLLPDALADASTFASGLTLVDANSNSHQLFRHFRGYFSAHPKLILTSDDKLLEYSQTATIGSIPHLAFGRNIPIQRAPLVVKMNKSARNVMLKYNMNEPLLFHMEVQQRYNDSLSAFFKQRGQKYTFAAVDYASLIVGYVHDFRSWIDADVIPSDAHPGNIFFRFSAAGNALFYWGEFGPASRPQNTVTSWSSAIGCFTVVFKQLDSYINNSAAFQYRELILDLRTLMQDFSDWQSSSYHNRRVASSRLLAMQIALVDRIMVFPDDLRVSFFQRMSPVAVQPLAKLREEIANVERKLEQQGAQLRAEHADSTARLEQRLSEQSDLISELRQYMLLSGQRQASSNASTPSPNETISHSEL